MKPPAVLVALAAILGVLVAGCVSGPSEPVECDWTSGRHAGIVLGGIEPFGDASDDFDAGYYDDAIDDFERTLRASKAALADIKDMGRGCSEGEPDYNAAMQRDGVGVLEASIELMPLFIGCAENYRDEPETADESTPCQRATYRIDPFIERLGRYQAHVEERYQ